jgi:hypothetical protein
MKSYNDMNHFLARLQAIFENDHKVIHARLEQVAQAFTELEEVSRALETIASLTPGWKA